VVDVEFQKHHRIVERQGLIHNGMNSSTSYAHMNTNEFDWRLVRSFLGALEHGSLMGAARALHTSQPTLGRHIAELESQLGAVLFERTGRGLVPTATALRLADAARNMEAAANDMARSVVAQDKAVTGSVRLSATQPVACHLLPPLLMAMREALPHIQIDLVVSNKVSNLLRREADIALRMVRPDQGSLVARRIGTVHMTACAQRDYLHRRGTPQVPDDLLQHDVIGFDAADDLIKGFAALGHPVEREQFALRTDDLIAYWQAVRAGLGVGFVARYLVDCEPDVLPVLPELSLPTLPVWLTVHREIRTNTRVRAVFDFLASHLPPML
jgi:DNA-binding transcriptional LysR family regulator